MDGTVKIHLGGYLGKLFGAEWNLFVSSPAEAIRAIDANLKGKLREYLSLEGRDTHYRVALGREENGLDDDGVRGPCGHQDIYILPVIKGRNSGLGKIFTAIALVIVAVYFPFALPGLTVGETTSVLYLTAASLTLGGITQLLTPTPNFNQDNSPAEAGSNIFQGNSTSIAQGASVGLVYGRMLVIPMPISLSLTNYDQSAANSFAAGTYNTINGPGGIVNQAPVDINPTDNLPN